LGGLSCQRIHQIGNFLEDVSVVDDVVMVDKEVIVMAVADMVVVAVVDVMVEVVVED